MGELELMSLELGHRIALLVLSVTLFGVVLELVRRDLLKERYALLWFATSLFGLVIGIFPKLLVVAAAFLRFQLLTLLFVLAFVFTLSIVLIFTVVISRLSERNRKLAQEVALLGARIEESENRGDDK